MSRGIPHRRRARRARRARNDRKKQQEEGRTGVNVCSSSLHRCPRRPHPRGRLDGFLVEKSIAPFDECLDRVLPPAMSKHFRPQKLRLQNMYQTHTRTFNITTVPNMSYSVGGRLVVFLKARTCSVITRRREHAVSMTPPLGQERQETASKRFC